MKKISVIILLLLAGVCSAQDQNLFLRNNLALSSEGDYMIVNYSKSTMMLHINKRSEDILILEEIIMPLSDANIDWQSWMKLKAPTHTSWSLYEIDIMSGKIQSCYSISEGSWLNLDRVDLFLSTLLGLEFEKVAENKRKKIGPHPNTDQPDYRKIWNPRLVFEGNAIQGAVFTAWKSCWPKDGGELSGKVITIYLPNDAAYLNYFPYWIQIQGSAIKFNFKVVNSGKNLTSPYTIG